MFDTKQVVLKAIDEQTLRNTKVNEISLHFSKNSKRLQYKDSNNVITSITSPAVNKRPIAVVIGNSIAAAMRATVNPVTASNATGAFVFKHEILFANAMLGDVFDFPEITATALVDQYGIFGDSGQQIPVIQTDVETNLFVNLDNAGIVPDLIICPALMENDIGNNASIDFATIQTRLLNFINYIKARYPGAVLVIGSPRPSFSYTTAAQITTYQAVTSYLPTLDNGFDLITYLNNSYEDPANPAKPLATVIIGTIASNVLTINSIVSGGNVRIGAFINNLSTTYIASSTSGNGGAGVYPLGGTGVSDVLTPTLMTIYTYTDAAVHPQPSGVHLNALNLANAIGKVIKTSKSQVVISGNPGLTGSASFSGINYSGTFPTGTSVSATSTATTLVATAMNPGLRLNFTNFADSGTFAQIHGVLLNDYTPTFRFDAIQHRVKFKITKGAQYIRYVNPNSRLNDNGTLSGAIPWLNLASSLMRADYIEGQMYTLTSPIIHSSGYTAANPMFNRIMTYFNVFINERVPANAVIEIEIYEAGYILATGINKGYITLAAGSAVVPMPSITASKTIKLATKAIGGTPGALFVSAIVPGTSFTISSTSGTDTSTVFYEVVI